MALAKALAKNTRIEDLHLGYNRIYDHGVQHLARALRRNRRLKRLHLESNAITDQGADVLLHSLQRNIGVTELFMRSNKVTAGMLKRLDDAAESGSARIKWSALRKIEDIEWQAIDPKGAPHAEL